MIRNPTKPGQLTEEEFRQIELHPMVGFLILQQLKNLKPILPGVRNHHEAFNGKGYPNKLKGEEIPLMARIIAVADSDDAMVSDRTARGCQSNAWRTSSAGVPTNSGIRV